MTHPYSLPVLISQIPYVQQIHNYAAAHPELLQSHLSQLALQKHIQEQKEVPKVDKTDTNIGVSPDTGQKQQAKGQEQKEKQEPKSEQDQIFELLDQHIIDVQV